METTWIDELGRKCMNLDSMINKLECFTELDITELEEYICNSENEKSKDYLLIKIALAKLSLSLANIISEDYFIKAIVNMENKNIYTTKNTNNSFVYIAKQLNETNIYKIGVTKNISKRVQTFKTGNPFVEIVLYSVSNNPYILEKLLHSTFKTNNIAGEWFILSNDDLLMLKTSFGFSEFLL